MRKMQIANQVNERIYKKPRLACSFLKKLADDLCQLKSILYILTLKKFTTANFKLENFG